MEHTINTNVSVLVFSLLDSIGIHLCCVLHDLGLAPCRLLIVTHINLLILKSHINSPLQFSYERKDSHNEERLISLYSYVVRATLELFICLILYKNSLSLLLFLCPVAA